MMKFLQICLCIFVFAGICRKSSAQIQSSFLIKKVQLKGLPSEAYYSSVQQDNDGFLWIGTLSGLFRYDGTRVKKFLRDPSDSNSLTHNYAKSLAKDAKGNLWIGTYGGFMNVHERHTGKIKRVEPWIKTQIRVTVMAIKPSVNETILAATAQCIYRINQDGHVTDSVFLFKDQTRITDFLEYEPYKAIITTTNGLYHLDWKNLKIQQIPFAIPLKEFRCIEKDEADTLWIGGNMGAFLLSSRTLQVMNPGEFDKLKKTTVGSIRKDKKGRMWIGTDDGLFVAENNRLVKIVSTDTALKPLQIVDVFVDKNEVVWVATSYYGLYQVYQPSLSFNHLPGMQQLAKKGKIGSIMEERPGSWLIATSGGLFRFTFSNQQFEPIELSKKEKNLLVQCQLKDNTNSLWIGTASNGIFYLAPGTNRFIHFLHDPLNENSLPSNNITSLEEDEHGLIWIGTYNGGSKMNSVCYYDPASKVIKRIRAEASNSNSLHASSISQIEADNKQQLWIGSWDDGLYRYRLAGNEPPQNTFTNYSESADAAHKISHNVVSCIRPGKDGMIWFGTVSGGLNVLDTKTDSVHWYTTTNGLASNLIYRIEQDDMGILWISTDNGISRFDPATKSFMNYDISSGLLSESFSFLTSLKCNDGTIAFGTNDGHVVHFNPHTFKNSSNPQKTVITDIRLSNKSITPADRSILKKACYLTDTILLNHDQSVISFDLANMDFINPGNYTYAYKLYGFDKEWTYITDRNSITYTNLDPGTYTLLIKNADHRGIWNETPTKLVLIIKPPFWLTWWFITLVILIIVSIIYLLFRYRLQQKLKLFAVRQGLHRDLHDDVGATLSSVKAYSEILKENPGNPVIAELIKDNSTEMLERLEVIAWATNPQHDNFKSLKSQMTKFAVPLCHSKNIQCNIESNGVKEELLMSGKLRQNVFLVFKEAVNNMIKYADATDCTIQFFIRDSRFVLQMIDNGIGADGTIIGGGSGWKNMQKRTQELNGQLKIRSAQGKGTTIIMELPYPFKIPSSWEIKRNGY